MIIATADGAGAHCRYFNLKHRFHKLIKYFIVCKILSSEVIIYSSHQTNEME